MLYNNKVERIPSNIVAKICNFKSESFLEVTDEERAVQKVSFE
jgi:hypothetical protein